MATKKKVVKKDTAEKKSSATSKKISSTNADDKELVLKASINATLEDGGESAGEKEPVKETKPAPKASADLSSLVTVMNTSYNEIFLNPGHMEAGIRIAPKEIKRIDRSTYVELMKNQVVRNWFDKGILATSKDAGEVSLHEAKVPENLKGPVERTDAVSTVSAQVTKFKKDGKVEIKL